LWCLYKAATAALIWICRGRKSVTTFMQGKSWLGGEWIYGFFKRNEFTLHSVEYKGYGVLLIKYKSDSVTYNLCFTNFLMLSEIMANKQKCHFLLPSPCKNKWTMKNLLP
jgi:hypothetical protein